MSQSELEENSSRVAARRRHRAAKAGSGFTAPEIMIVLGIILIMLSISLPDLIRILQNYRTLGDARSIAAELALARMSAASNYTRSRVSFNLTANTYQVELWSRSSKSYQIEGGVQSLSQGITFGYGNITTPAGGQTTIAQTPQFYFNSRGISVDSSGNAVGTDAIYVTNNNGLTCAITASLSGQPEAWKYNGTTWVAF